MRSLHIHGIIKNNIAPININFYKNLQLIQCSRNVQHFVLGLPFCLRSVLVTRIIYIPTALASSSRSLASHHQCKFSIFGEWRLRHLQSTRSMLFFYISHAINAGAYFFVQTNGLFPSWPSRIYAYLNFPSRPPAINL